MAADQFQVNDTLFFSQSVFSDITLILPAVTIVTSNFYMPRFVAVVHFVVWLNLQQPGGSVVICPAVCHFHSYPTTTAETVY